MEQIIDKLRKIQALAEKGCQGEAMAAKLLLDKMLTKYGMTLSDLEFETTTRYAFKYRTVAEHDLIVQTIAKVVNRRQVHCFVPKGKREIRVDLTAAQLIDVKEMLGFYLRQFRTELKKQEATLVHAFIIKQRIFPDEPSEGSNTQEKKLTPEEIRALFNMIDTLEDLPGYYKQLTK
jgi:hypothetical protein